MSLFRSPTTPRRSPSRPTQAGTLTYAPAWSWWLSDTTFLARYNVADADALVASVGVHVTGGGYDAATYQLQSLYEGTDDFSIDTLDPPPPAANATAIPGDGANPPAPLYTVTAANVTSPPSDTFSLTAGYDQAMDPATAPTITLTNEDPNGAGITSTLQYDDANSSWLDNQHFQARYTVIDNGIYIPHVDVGIAGAVDAAGNLQDPAALADLFSIDTAAAPITVTSVQPQAYVDGAWTAATQITDANIGTDTFRINVYYSAASVMNTPTITYSPDVSTAVILDPNWSFWVSSTEYRATYSVSAADVAANPLQIKIERARDTTATHYDQAFYVATALFTIDTTNPPPQNLTANAASQTEIDLSWTDTSPNATGYVVQYSSDETVWNTLTTINDRDETSCSDTTTITTEGTVRYYRVKATGLHDDSDYSDIAVGASRPLPPTIQEGVAISGDEIDLTWTDASPNASAYAYAVDQLMGDGTWQEVDVMARGANADTVPGPFDASIPGTPKTYGFKVRALTAYSSSEPSPEYDVTTPAWPPVPANFTATHNASGTEIDLSWDPSPARPAMQSPPRTGASRTRTTRV